MSEPLVLASKSASRRAMLLAADIAHEAIPADLDEEAVKCAMADAPASAIALALAREKAVSVSRQMPGRLVLGSDSMVTVAGRRFDKPVSRADAAAHLHAFSGQVMILDSAAAFARDGQILAEMGDAARLHVRTLDAPFIVSYLDAEWPAIAGCVGCFRIEGRGVHLFSALEGDHFTILGLPLLPVLQALRDLGQGAA